MSWFKPKYSVCHECLVHFEPPVSAEHKAFGHLCQKHRVPAMEKENRKRAVINWATANWEKLEDQMKTEYAKHNQMSQEALSKMAQSQFNSSSGGAGYSAGSALSEAFGLAKAKGLYDK